MSSDNDRRPAPSPAPEETGSGTSRRDGPQASDFSSAPEKNSPPLPSHSLFRPDREDCPLPAAPMPTDRKQEASSAVEGDYFPEDERSPMDWENDSSTADFDLNAELEARLGKAPPLPPADERPAPGPCPLPAGAEFSASSEQYFPEDERSSPDWEDDHSTEDFDLNAGIDSSPGKAHENEADAVTPDDGGYMHPGLAASLSASLAYSRHGLRRDEEQTDHPSGSEDESHGGQASEKTATDTGLTARDTPDSQRENKRPFDDESAAAASGQADPAGSVPAVSRNAAPAGASGGGGGGGGDAGDSGDEDDDEEGDDEAEDEEEDEEGGLGRPMTLRDHLNELRKRVTWAFLWAIVGFVICYPFAQELFDLLLAPLTRALPSAGHLIFTSPPEAFFTYMKVAFVAGLFLTSPLVFYQIWAFVAPGLYKDEKAHILPIAFFSALFFITGGAFCYFVTFPFAFEFFMSYSTDVIVAMPALGESLSFVLQLLLAFGLVFELPLFVFFLARLGLVTADMMRKFRRYAILVNVIVAAILTPPDVMSQMLMAGPLILLYELSILIAAVFGKKTEKPAKDDTDAEDDDEEEDGEEDAPSSAARA